MTPALILAKSAHPHPGLAGITVYPARDLGLACLDVSQRGQPDYDARMIARQHKADGVKKYSGAQRQPKTTILLQHRPPPDDSAEPFDPGGDSHLLVTIQGILE